MYKNVETPNLGVSTIFNGVFTIFNIEDLLVKNFKNLTISN